MKDYNKMMSGYKGGKVMKNHGNTSSISSDAQSFDLNRMKWLAKEKRGYDSKAYEYKY